MSDFLWWDEKGLTSWLMYQDSRYKTEYLADEIYLKVYQINQLFSSKPYGNLIDRTGNISHFLPVNVRRPYRYRRIDKDWVTVSLDTARDIDRRSSARIVVKWSGGIDSTNALVALLQVTDPKKIIILCDHRSIDEFPEFYTNIIKGRLEEIDPFQWANWDWSQGDVCVTGDCGDCVWAVIDQSFWNHAHQWFHQPWQHWVTWQEKQRDVAIDHDFLERVCAWSGVELRTTLDLRTWFYLNFKWQDKAMDSWCFGPDALNHANNIVFYDHNDGFENWTMNNLDQMGGKSFADCKMPAKLFIHDYFPCQRYLREKTKVNSGFWVDSTDGVTKGQRFNFMADAVSKGHSSKPIAIDQNYRRHHLVSMPLLDFDQYTQWNNQSGFVSRAMLTTLASNGSAL